jgi:type I restriction-modification system DNA methylase subunit
MPTPAQIEAALSRVTDQASFLQKLLIETLDWPADETIERVADIAYGWSDDDLRSQGMVRGQLQEGQVWQFQPFRADQPWGIFLLQFNRADLFGSRGGLTGATGVLRKVLRGLVPSRRRDPALKAWQREHLLFICTHDYKQFRFAYFKRPHDEKLAAPLAFFGWNRGETHVRTLCEFNLRALAYSDDWAPADWLGHWTAAFDVEAVTKRFFAEYAQVFNEVEDKVKGVPKGEARRLYTQRLFNRLMFLYFIQRKGWLSFQGDKRYLRALFNAATAAKEDFLNDRLYWTFFAGLNTINEDAAVHAHVDLKERRGEVPFLNGGLFDLEDEYDIREKVKIPNAAFASVLDLFERYNFTVTESTPLDVEVAVDPEMLGKVFEELVTGRHETGSYYTPRPIVAFMCREALKHYLVGQAFQPDRPDRQAGKPDLQDAVARFVDDGDPLKLPDPEAVLNALRAVKVCDPACGSGAYLLGMMQELLRLREALFATKGLDAVTVYLRKLEIIQNNLYGVDIDVFAVNIAKLRLWLSLAVDFEGITPPPLPNLDFKIECGDSLTAPNPEEIPDLFRGVLVKSADRLAELKGKFLQTYGAEKKKLAGRIKNEEANLRESLHEQMTAGSVDWRVAFAEVFKNGGFDIALENPPYVRMELFKETKPILRRNFPHVYDASADLYVYFFARTHQLLRPGGTASFISSNKWLKAGYGEALRRFLAGSAWVASVVDFGHAKQIFQDADVFPSILVVRKPTAGTPPPTPRVCTIPRERLRLDDLSRQVETEAIEVPRNRLSADSWTLEPPGVVALMEKIQHAGMPLKEYAKVSALLGIKTALNEAFLLDSPTRKSLVLADAKCSAIIKPYVRGQDIDRWVPQWADYWMIVLKSSGDHEWPWSDAGQKAERVFEQTYPSIHAHLNRFRAAAIKRQDQGRYWWELRSCAFWDLFERPKIWFQQIQYHPWYAFDRDGLLGNNKTTFLPTDDLYLLAVLNSPLMWWHNFRRLPHMKDEALAPVVYMVDTIPVAQPTDKGRTAVQKVVARLLEVVTQQQRGHRAVLDWLCVEFGVEKPSQKLQDVANLDEDTLAAEVQKAHGKKQPLSAAQLKALRDAHARSVRPLQALAAEALQLERRVADLVNAAYGLTAEEVELMWRTAPPRMPGAPPGV